MEEHFEKFHFLVKKKQENYVERVKILQNHSLNNGGNIFVKKFRKIRKNCGKIRNNFNLLF